VFNAGCRAILGSLDARQLERELMHQDVRGGDHSDDNSDNNSGDSGGEDNDDFVMVQAPRGEHSRCCFHCFVDALADTDFSSLSVDA
jgi:hypothetical protein